MEIEKINIGDTIVITRENEFFNQEFVTVECPMGSEHLGGVWVTSPHLGSPTRVPLGTYKLKSYDDIDTSLRKQRDDQLRSLFT